MTSADLTTKNIDDNKQNKPSKEKLKNELNDTSSTSLNDKNNDLKSVAAEKPSTTTENSSVARVEELSASEDKSSSLTSHPKVAPDDIPKDKNLDVVKESSDSQNKLASADLTRKNIDNNKQRTSSEEEEKLKGELNNTSLIALKDESQSKAKQIVSNQPSKRKTQLESEILNASNIDSQIITESDDDEQKLAFNKDFSEVKDNIRSFSNSLSGDEDTDLFQQRTSDKSKGTREIVIPGKIEKNVPLKTGTVDVSAMMIKRNGDFVETAKANRTHAIRVNFKMYKNENITPGNKEIFIIIQNPKGKVINEKGTFALRTGVEIPYSDETVAYYDGNNINISILSDKFVQKFVKGTYIVKIFIERYLTGQTLLILS